MNQKKARLSGAVAGALVAGIGITALLIANERKSRTPSELAVLEREAMSKLGGEPAGGLPSAREQAGIQGGHLLLSAAAGATFAATIPDNAPPIPAGLAFGAAFYAAMHWIIGPLLGVKKPEWRADYATIGMHAANHAVFGVATAVGARLAERLAR